MGVHNIKLESEVFQALPQFQWGGGITPVETKPDFTSLVSQLAQVQLGLNQIQQTLSTQGISFPSRTPVETKIDPTTAGGIRAEVAQFHIPSRTPVETKVDPSLLSQVATRLNEAGQSFTRLAEVAVEGKNLVEEVRKLNQRLDDIEGKLAKGK